MGGSWTTHQGLQATCSSAICSIRQTNQQNQHLVIGSRMTTTRTRRTTSFLRQSRSGICLGRQSDSEWMRCPLFLTAHTIMLPCRIDGIRQLTLRLDKAITGRCQLITDVNQRHPDPAGTKAAILTMRRLRLKKFGAHQCKTSGRTSRTTDIILLRLIRCGTTLTRTTTGRRCRRRRTCMRTHGTHLHRIRAFNLTRRQIRAFSIAVSNMCRILGEGQAGQGGLKMV